MAGSGSGAMGGDSSASEGERGVRAGGGRPRCVVGWTAACSDDGAPRRRLGQAY
jgi:hypothetical protein